MAQWKTGQGIAWAVVGGVALRVRKSGSYYFGEVTQPGRPAFCIGPQGRLGSRRACQRFDTIKATQGALEAWAYQNVGTQPDLVSSQQAGFRLTHEEPQTKRRAKPQADQLSLLRGSLRRDR